MLNVTESRRWRLVPRFSGAEIQVKIFEIFEL